MQDFVGPCSFYKCCILKAILAIISILVWGIQLSLVGRKWRWCYQTPLVLLPSGFILRSRCNLALQQLVASFLSPSGSMLQECLHHKATVGLLLLPPLFTHKLHLWRCKATIACACYSKICDGILGSEGVSIRVQVLPCIEYSLCVRRTSFYASLSLCSFIQWCRWNMCSVMSNSFGLF